MEDDLLGHPKPTAMSHSLFVPYALSPRLFLVLDQLPIRSTEPTTEILKPYTLNLEPLIIN
jgi:hypothetical protein